MVAGGPVGASGVGRGRRGRVRARRPASACWPLELAFEVVLGLGGVDAGAPQLVHDEQQDQHTAPDHQSADRAEPSCECHAGTIVNRRVRLPGGPSRVGPPSSPCPQVPSVIPMEPVVHLRAAVSLLGRFPALAGVDLDVDPARSCCSRAPTGPARPRCCARLAGPAAGGRRARRWCSATTCGPTARPSAAGSACSATPPCSTTSSPWPTTCGSGPGPRGAAPADAEAAMARAGPRRPAPRRHRRAPVRRAAPPRVARGVAGPPARALAARRAPCRARRRHPRRGRRSRRAGPPRPAPPSSWPPTSSTGPRPWPAARSPSSAACHADGADAPTPAGRRRRRPTGSTATRPTEVEVARVP